MKRKTGKHLLLLLFLLPLCLTDRFFSISIRQRGVGSRTFPSCSIFVRVRRTGRFSAFAFSAARRSTAFSAFTLFMIRRMHLLSFSALFCIHRMFSSFFRHIYPLIVSFHTSFHNFLCVFSNFALNSCIITSDRREYNHQKV